MYFTGDERAEPYFEEVDKYIAKAFTSDVNLAEYKSCGELGKEVAYL